MQAAARASSIVLCALVLCACSSTRVQRTPAAGPVPPATAPLTVAPQLAAEQRWLLDLFRGTPVSIEAGAGGVLRVEVPLRYAFDSGRPAIKPPLGAVLDKITASLGRLPQVRAQIAAPTAERADSVREGLVTRGVAVYRIGRLPARPDAVELRLLPAPGPIERLEDPPQGTGGRR